MPTVQQATAATKARIAAKKAGAGKDAITSIKAPSTPNAYGGDASQKSAPPSAPADVIKDPVTGSSYSRASSQDTYKPYTPPVIADTSSGGTGAATSKKESKDSTQEYFPRYTSGDSMAPIQPRSVEELQREKTKAAQGEINALHDYEATLLKEQAVINDKADRSVASINTLTGLGGSTEANNNQQAQTQKNQQANRLITDNIRAQIQGVLTDIRKEAITEARQSRLDARSDETASIANQAARRENANKNLTTLSASGVTYDGLKKEDPEAYQYFVDIYGSEDAVKGAFILNTPQDQIVDKQIKGGSYVIARQNPITGAIKIETIDLGLPPNYIDTIDAGDVILAVPENWDGDPTSLISIPKGLDPKDQPDNSLPPGNDDAFRYQPGYAALTANQKKQADSLNNLVRTLDEYYDYFDTNVNADGSELIGEESAILETKLNSIIFAAAQAEGTGALQQADREVIERIIPNPTTLTGAFNAWTKGGKKGSLGKIKDQVNKYRDTLESTYGLEPVVKDSNMSADLTPEERQQLIDEGFDPDEVSFNGVGNTKASVNIPKTSRLAYVNNNPGNLRYAGQEGATKGEGGFARFSTPTAGLRALENQIALDARRGHTLASFATKYAPPTENNTKKYITDLVAMTGADATTPIKDIDPITLARAVAKKESSTQIS